MRELSEIYGPYSIIAYLISGLVIFLRGKHLKLENGGLAYTNKDLTILVVCSYGILLSLQLFVNHLTFSNGYQSFLEIMCTTPSSDQTVVYFWVYYITAVTTIFIWFSFGNAAKFFTNYHLLLRIPNDVKKTKALLLSISISTGIFWPAISYFGYFDYFCA